MSLASVRQFYGVPAYRGTAILYTGGDTPRQGVIVSATTCGRLRIRWDDDPSGRRAILHPTWEVQYLPETPDDEESFAVFLPHGCGPRRKPPPKTALRLHGTRVGLSHGMAL